jgi:hypothetical protein
MSDLEKEEVQNYIEHLKDVKLQMAEDLLYEGANDGGALAHAQGKVNQAIEELEIAMSRMD